MSIPRHFLLNNEYILFFSTCSPGPEYEMHGADNVYIHFRVIAKQRAGELEQSCCPTVKSWCLGIIKEFRYLAKLNEQTGYRSIFTMSMSSALHMHLYGCIFVL